MMIILITWLHKILIVMFNYIVRLKNYINIGMIYCV